MDMITQVIEKINTTFNDDYLNKLAYETGFIRRKRKIMARLFLEKIISVFLSTPDASLEYFASAFADQNLIVSKPALHKKFNPQTVKFTEQILEFLLKDVFNKHPLGLKVLPEINNIIVGDSSIIRLSDALKGHFPAQRNAKSASIKIQAVMNVLDNQIKSLEITSAREPDQGYKKYLDYVQGNDLWIGDLGYFALASFKTICEKGAFFLSRYFRRTTLYDESGTKPINLRQQLTEAGEDQVELTVKLGSKGVVCRCIALRLSEKDYEKRLKNLKEKSRRSSRKSFKAGDVLNQWTILVTNLPQRLEATDLWKLYRLRWQIELLFKMMKTFLNLRAVKTVNSHRTMVSIHVSLMVMTLLTLVTMTIPDREVSLYKACRWFTRHIDSFLQSLGRQTETMIIGMREKIKRFCCKETRKKRLSTRQILAWETKYA